MRLLIQAADEFWSTAERDQRGTPPSNSEIIDWLMKQGLSTSLAEKGASIIRPAWAGVGRRPGNGEST